MAMFKRDEGVMPLKKIFEDKEIKKVTIFCPILDCA
jgi:hypothetical protein